MFPLPAMIVGVVLGATLGSFAVTYAIRWARAESVFKGRSSCDRCRITLGFARTVPLWSYAVAKGACFNCGARIDLAHPAAEALGAVLGALCLAVLPPIAAALSLAMGLTLLASAAADIRVQRLPDGLTALVAALAMALAYDRGGLPSLVTGLIAASATFAILLGVRAASQRLKGRPALGLGDVKFAAALALWLGTSTPAAIAAASLAGLGAMALLRPRDGRLAFGPCLAGAAWLVGFVGEAGWWRMTP